MKKKQLKYKLILKVNEKDHKAECKTMLECVEKIIPQNYLKTIGVFTIEYGENKKTLLMGIGRMKRYFASKVGRIVLAKNLQNLVTM